MMRLESVTSSSNTSPSSTHQGTQTSSPGFNAGKAQTRRLGESTSQMWKGIGQLETSSVQQKPLLPDGQSTGPTTEGPIHPPHQTCTVSYKSYENTAGIKDQTLTFGHTLPLLHSRAKELKTLGQPAPTHHHQALLHSPLRTTPNQKGNAFAEGNTGTGIAGI